MPEQNELAVNQVDTKTAKTASDAVWNFMTSLKSVCKRDNQEQSFDLEKLKKSIAAAMDAVGKKESNRAEDIANQVVSRLIHIYDGHTVPMTADIREVVNVTLIDNNMIHVAKQYIEHRQRSRSDLVTEPTYGNGIEFSRFFTKDKIKPFDQITWEKRDARITNEKGEIVFEQKEVEVPVDWSQTATNIVVSKYFRGQIGKDDRETSVKQMIGRVSSTISDWGSKDGYFQSATDAKVFEEELTYILVNQMAAFNSPVWFNVGIVPRPQCSACFINSVSDDMRSIMHLAATETMLFKGGSGTGTNLSSLRSSKEFLGGSNGRSSGPVSFMKGFDAFAGVIKSGGKTRRAAKMVILNIDHPDIEEFINCKDQEEKKAWALMDAGYDGSIDGPAYSSIFFQNANNSVRVTDDFMKAVENDDEWQTYEVTTGNPSVKHKARDLMDQICQTSWQCGDPGMQYDTTTNRWNTCKGSGRINASNPCSEYMFLDDSACNLSSLNLMRFRKKDPATGQMVFDPKAFKKAAEVMITAMEIVVDRSSYPTPAIEQNSHLYRALGIGYANLGALLMSQGVAYDSDQGRDMAAAISSLMTAHCYLQSARIAKRKGTFSAYEKNRESVLDVLKMHQTATKDIAKDGSHQEVLLEALAGWDKVIDKAEVCGVRNAQISLLAPTGTIAFLMDCDTTGIEPDIALVKYKWLVGGGMVKIVNQSVAEALDRIGYSKEEIDDIIKFIDEKDTIEGAPHIQEKHLSVFDCAFKAKNGLRTIHYMGHLRMMGAVQPFLSGAISKTVNMPNNATPAQVAEVYTEGWKMGLKAIAIYRDGSKRQQPLTTSLDQDQSKTKVETKIEYKPRRRPMPDERRSITHKFVVGNHVGYATVGLYDDGTPGEVFISMNKEGSVISGLMDSFAVSISIGLQYGVPLSVLVNKFVHMRFEPSGYTNNPNIRIAKSLVDYIFRWMAMKFLAPEDAIAVGVNATITDKEEALAEKVVSEAVVVNPDEHSNQIADDKAEQSKLFENGTSKPEDSVDPSNQNLGATFDNQSDAPPCDTCGSVMVRNGACYKCLNCGATSGCS
ncbi:MAG: vitamin B12-dependent ribonucleotide reductase [Candidatus Uhrbacteria bacterium]